MALLPSQQQATVDTYGVRFPAATSHFFRLLWLWKHYPTAQKLSTSLPDRHELVLEAIPKVFTPQQVTIDPWFEEYAHIWSNNRFATVWGPASCGKGLLPWDVVMTPDGPEEMQNISIGDEVLNQDGIPVKVTDVPFLGDCELYRVHFSDGTHLDTSAEHLWEVYSRSYKWGTRGPNSKSFRIKSTEDLFKLGKPGEFYLPQAGPAQFKERPVSLDPYVLGCLLGDGSLCDAIVFTKTDPDVRSRFESRLPPGVELVSNGNGKDFRIQPVRKHGPNPVKEALGAYGLRGTMCTTKFIPDDYLYNSVEKRTALLSGLLDTDGTVEKTGRIEFSTTSPMLRDGVCFLVRSLGGIARVAEKQGWYPGPGGTRT